MPPPPTVVAEPPPPLQVKEEIVAAKGPIYGVTEIQAGAYECGIANALRIGEAARNQRSHCETIGGGTGEWWESVHESNDEEHAAQCWYLCGIAKTMSAGLGDSGGGTYGAGFGQTVSGRKNLMGVGRNDLEDNWLYNEGDSCGCNTPGVRIEFRNHLSTIINPNTGEPYNDDIYNVECTAPLKSIGAC
tara:strand:- start:651 stop:1217 length:567 start_codon:yes stop_codon:yes gene_type:complete